MTRVLSELLEAPEPAFRLQLMQLENSSGRPNHDIRLSAEIMQQTQAKLHALSLDPHDTHGRELYNHLGERLRQAEDRFAAAIRASSTKTDDPIAHVAKRIEAATAPAGCFALKNTVAKRLLKANVPKKTMKVLGYRSAESMLKHESVASLYAAASMIESPQWMKRQITSYGKLKAADFESRKIAIEHPTSKRWQAVAETAVAVARHNILGFKELGAVVLLPLPEKRPQLITLTTALLTLHTINDIRAASTYLKLHQVRPDFSALVGKVVQGDAVISTTLLDRPVSWSMVQQYYARFSHLLDATLFEPVLQAEDFVWHSVEQVIAAIEPSLEFFEGTSYLALLHEGDAVSCNLTDMVLSHCNRLPYASRQNSYFKQALSTELSMRYLNPDRLAETLGMQLQKQLAMEPALA